METILVVSSFLLWLIVVLNLLLTIALVRRLSAKPRPTSLPWETLEVGQRAPDFSAQTLSGETVTLSTFAGRKTAFLFISTHCDPCKQLLPRLEPLGPKAARAGVELVLVSGDGFEATRTFAEEMSITLPVLVAPKDISPLMADYKATMTPFYCLVDEQGKIQSSGYPSLEWGEWKTLVDSWTTEAAPLSNGRLTVAAADSEV
jgi:peroxiredoxin